MIDIKRKCFNTPSKSVINEELTLNEPKNISNAMNKFFINIDKKIANSIPIVCSSVSLLLQPLILKLHIVSSNLYATHGVEETIINGLKSNTAIKYVDVDTKLIELSKNITSPE